MTDRKILALTAMMIMAGHPNIIDHTRPKDLTGRHPHPKVKAKRQMANDSRKRNRK